MKMNEMINECMLLLGFRVSLLFSRIEVYNRLLFLNYHFFGFLNYYYIFGSTILVLFFLKNGR
jgi:hypothetical protein